MSRGGPVRDEWGLAPHVANQVWHCFGRPVADLFASAENAQCPLWFTLCLSTSAPLNPAPQSEAAEASHSGSGPRQSRSQVVPGSGTDGSVGSLAPPRRARRTVAGRGGSPVTSFARTQTPGLDVERGRPVSLGLPSAVVSTIQCSRASSTTKAYSTRWRVFTAWCEDRALDPSSCPVNGVLEFLQ